MIFTSIDFLLFLAIAFAFCWIVRSKRAVNAFLLVASYVFYGYVHPWFCILLAASTVVDFLCGLGMAARPGRKKQFLVISMISNLGILGAFKYFNFFAENVYAISEVLGLSLHPVTFQVFLPAGISFYTFQTMSYTIDVYRGHMEARRNFLDFAVFVAMFPQLVAGPIERAIEFLPQIERRRRWDTDLFLSAWPLIVWGYFKKLVVADNVAVYVDKIFMLKEPAWPLLVVGALGFAVQIYADFSAYTDIARGVARLLGFQLMVNFNAPYLAVSPSDFWRRWHISFSSWIRDYLYIPLGGSRGALTRYALTLLIAMGLSGLWHGAQWHFVMWGLYHGVLIFVYHLLGLFGRWRPTGLWRTALAWFSMFTLTVVGWLIFRASSMSWLISAIGHAFAGGVTQEEWLVAATIACFVAAYAMPMIALHFSERLLPKQPWVCGVLYGGALTAIAILARDARQDFIYFRF